MNKKNLISASVLLLIMITTIRIVQSVVFIYVVSGDSMVPIIEHGDVILTLDIPWDKYERGDIVVFELDDIDIKNGIMVKQVFGIPGDHIWEKDGYLYLNGEQSDIYTHGHIEFSDTELNEERYYLVGTNSRESYDSRSFGPVREDEIIGKYYMTFDLNLPFVRRLI